MGKLTKGAKAPSFTLPDQTGALRSLRDFDAQYVVLFFYPKDSTPGCTIEANEFSRKLRAFRNASAVVVGISGGSVLSKEKFCKKYNLKLTLLADHDFAVSKKFHAFGEKKFMGRRYNGIYRKTFVINRAGKVIQMYPEVKPEGHADEVLQFLSGMDNRPERAGRARVKKSVRRAKQRPARRSS